MLVINSSRALTSGFLGAPVLSSLLIITIPLTDETIKDNQIFLQQHLVLMLGLNTGQGKLRVEKNLAHNSPTGCCHGREISETEGKYGF